MYTIWQHRYRYDDYIQKKIIKKQYTKLQQKNEIGYDNLHNQNRKKIAKILYKVGQKCQICLLKCFAAAD